MIRRLIEASVRHRWTVLLLTFILAFWGIYAMFNLSVDAVPDVTNNQVQVITVSRSFAAQEMEQFVSFPVELAVSNLPGVTEVRSVSRFGLSTVTVIFEESMGIYKPRQLIQEKLPQIKNKIPKAAGDPFLAPITSGLGEIYQYTLEVEQGYDYSLTELREINDWIVARNMNNLKGVVGVNALGGKVKQYEVAVKPNQLDAHGLTIADVHEALSKNNANTGGAYIEQQSMAFFIRGNGLVENLEDLRKIVLKSTPAGPVQIGDVATVKFGHQPRFGAMTANGEGEAVGGIIMLLKGANTIKVMDDVKKRIAKIQNTLPEGVRIVPYYDRSELINRTTGTIAENLSIGGLIVIFVLVLLLGYLRAGLIIASVIPLSLLFAFVLMHQFGVWANLMSLGAIDFGILIDGAVIIVESSVFYLTRHAKSLGRRLSISEIDATTTSSASGMMRSAFFGQIIILIVYVPILFLTGVEGKMFRPMAYTLIFAMLGIILLCFTYVPAVSSLFLRPLGDPEKSKPWRVSQRIMARLDQGYTWVLLKLWHVRRIVLLAAAGALLGAIWLFTTLGGEFIPKLDEGDIAAHIILKPGSSLSESIESTTRAEKILLQEFPEVENVISRIGTPNVPTDPMPMDLSDLIINMKPRSEWQSGRNKAELIAAMKDTLRSIPGQTYAFTQPIQMRFNALLTGVRQDLAVKIYGEDLQLLAKKAQQANELIQGLPGVGDAKVEAITGMPQLAVNYDRDKLAQYGLDIASINELVQMGFGGGVAGTVYEGERRFDLVVRLDTANRNSLASLRDLLIPLPNGKQIPLEDVASVGYENGPMQISRDNTHRRVVIGINVRGRDVESLVADIDAKLTAGLDLPPGYTLDYGGSFENLQRAEKRLQFVVPLALMLIFILIFISTQNVGNSLLIFTAIPMAGIGGVVALALRDMPFSISAGVGFEALFGVAVLNGLVLINSFSSLRNDGVTDVRERILRGSRSRLLPILLTASTDILGFLPMAVSTSSGAEVQRPLATVVIGGMITNTLLILFVLPLLYAYSQQIKLRFKPKAALLAVALGVLLFPAGLSAQTNQAQPSISLENAIDRSEENFPAYRASLARTEAQAAREGTALNLPKTGLLGVAEEQKFESGQGNAGFQIKQRFDFPTTYARRGDWLDAKTLASERRSRELKSQMQFEVAKAYTRAQAAMQRRAILQRKDSLFADLVRKAKLRFESGATSKLAYLDARAERSKIQVALRKQQSKMDNHIATLNRYISPDGETQLRPDTTRLNFLADTAAQLDSHPILQRWEAVVSAKKAQSALTKTQVAPSFSFQLGPQWVNGNSGFFFGQVGVYIPLWTKPHNARIEAARIEQRAAALDADNARSRLQTALRQARANFQQATESYRYYQEEGLQLAREQQRTAIQGFQAGKLNYLDYLIFLTRSFDIRSAALDAWRERQLAALDLLYLTDPAYFN